MIGPLAERIATGIKSVVPEHPASVEVLRYSISFILNAAFIVMLSLMIAIFTGRLSETVIVLAAVAIMRFFSGGIHLESGLTCIAVSTIAVAGLSFAETSYTAAIWMSCASAVLVLAFAPSRFEKHARIPERYYPLLKVISLLIVGVGLLAGSSVLSAAILAQSSTLIRVRR